MRFFFLLILLLISYRTFAQEKTSYKITAVGFYNLENLFDTEDDPKIRDEEYLPEGSRKWDKAKYQTKLKNLSKVITSIGTDYGLNGPVILGVCEVENKKVLEDLVATDLMKSKNYGIVHYDSPDKRGIDVALLYQKSVFKVIAKNSHTLKDTSFFTRNQLVVTGVLESDTINFVVNHWPSRSGGQKRSEPRRLAAAEVARSITDSLYKINPEAKIILMGDFNDDPNNKSLRKVLKAESYEDGLKGQKLFNAMFALHKKGVGTLAYRDNWQIFDQIIISAPLLKANKKGNNYFYFSNSAKAFAPKWIKQSEGRYKGYPLRTFAGGNYLAGYSDHFPVFVLLAKENKK